MRFVIRFGLLVMMVVLCAPRAKSAEIDLRVDFNQPKGIIRPLHGINKGPLAFGGLIDLTEAQKNIGTPYIRLHDCQWPYPDVVDVHALFPNPQADPSQPENYEFRLTDDYLEAALKTKAQIIYRLGESIEHGAVKRYVHPPRDPNRWAAVCLGIIRHYNEGWANGFRHGIDYWEIWNEPENRPAMWTGTDEEFFALYRTAAKAIRGEFPKLKIGGPAVGYSGKFDGERFVPGEFVTNFLAFCRRESLPLDFFSWHCYTADVTELSRRAQAIRQLLDQNGFAKTESHLNEWNFLPGNTWSPIGKSAAPKAREEFYRNMAGPAGAAFIASALIELQDAPVDVANLFHGELGGFGLFNEHGVPNPNYATMGSFNELVKLKGRVQTSGEISGKLAMLAAIDPGKKSAAILISNFASGSGARKLAARVPADAKGKFEIRQLSRQDWSMIQTGSFARDLELPLKLEAPSVTLIQMFFEN